MSMTATAAIHVYPNKLDNSQVEVNLVDAGQTLEQWLVANVPAYYASQNPLFSATVNGQYLAPTQWPVYIITGGDQLELTVEAKEPMTIFLVVMAVVAVGAAIYMYNQLPDNYNNTTPDGSSIYDANAQGNRPRLMGVIPELAGRHKIFPDLLNAPRREYINNEQWIFLMLAVSVGDLEINSTDIMIGNTPVGNYAGDIVYQVFGPGVDVTGHEAFRNVYTSEEVGGTAGTTGIELKGKITSVGSSVGSDFVYRFTGDTIISGRKIIYTNVWEGYYYTVPFQFPPGDIVTVTGTAGGVNDGDYRILSISDQLFTNGSIAFVEKVDLSGVAIPGWTAFTEEPMVEALLVVSAGGGDGQYNGPYLATPAAELTNTIWLDFFMAQGLGELDDDGNYLNITVDINIQYRDENSATWIDVPHAFSGRTGDQLGETVKIIIPGASIRPVVQVKRVTAAVDNTRIYDRVEWTGLKSELDSAASYADVTTIAVKVRGTNALAGSAENKFNLIATRKLPTYTGGSWTVSQATTDIAPFFAYVIKDCGHSDTQIGLDALDALHTKWNGRGDEFNGIFDSASTLFPVLKRILAPGYAEPTLDYGQIIPVRDENRTVYDYMYQPDSMLKPGLKRNIKLIDADEPDGVEIEYFSAETWKPETIMCLLPGDLGINPKKIRAFGITDRTKAWRLGMRHRRIQRYRRTQYSFKTEMDALNSRYLSYDALADDIPGYSQSGRVESANGRAIIVGQPLEWGTGTHYLAIRKPDGKLSGPYTCTQGSDDFTVIVDSDLDFTPNFDGRQEPPFYMFGTATQWCRPALITNIKPQGTDTVSITAVNYDDRVYGDDDNTPPA